MKNLQVIQGVLSIAALICLVVGWFDLLSPEINSLLSRKIFYILIGASFILQAPLLGNKQLLYPMYASGALCIIGAFLPADSQYAVIKTVGLLAGVIISMFNRPRAQRNS